MLTELLPAHVRKIIYIAYALIGVILGAVQVWFATYGATGPEWVEPALAVYAFVGGAFGFVASSFTPSRKAPAHRADTDAAFE